MSSEGSASDPPTTPPFVAQPLAGPPAAEYLLSYPLPAVRGVAGKASVRAHLDLSVVAVQIWPIDYQTRAARLTTVSSVAAQASAGHGAISAPPKLRLAVGDAPGLALTVVALCADGSVVYAQSDVMKDRIVRAETLVSVVGGPYCLGSLVMRMPHSAVTD